VWGSMFIKDQRSGYGGPYNVWTRVN
jgi:hypothetical protein